MYSMFIHILGNGEDFSTFANEASRSVGPNNEHDVTKSTAGF